MRTPRIPWLMHLAVLLVVLVWELNGSMAKMRSITNKDILKKYVERKMGWATETDLSWDCESSHSETRYCEKGTQQGQGCTTKSAIRCSIRQKPVPQKKCLDDPVPFGIENGINTNINMTASRGFDEYHGASAGRLNGPDCWRPEKNTSSWIQVDLGRTTTVTGVITQGCRQLSCYVTTYEVDYQTLPSVTYYSVRDNGNVKEFRGNRDVDTPVTNKFPAIILATAIRIKPTAWEKGVGLRLELLGCPQLRCTKLGLEDRSIPDNRISASSSYSNYPPSAARLNNNKDWLASGGDQNPWIQVNLGEETAVSGIITQGGTGTYRVKKYKVAYQTEARSQLMYVLDGHGSEKVFSGNIDDAWTPVTNMFPETIFATVVRIEPIDWPFDAPSLRFELLNCKDVQ